MKVALVVNNLAWLGLAFYMSGCGLVGVKEVDLWGFKTSFAEGLDYHIGGNQINQVDDRKGLKTRDGGDFRYTKVSKY